MLLLLFQPELQWFTEKLQGPELETLDEKLTPAPASQWHRTPADHLPFKVHVKEACFLLLVQLWVLK